MSAMQPPRELTREPLGTVPATMHQQRNHTLKSGKRVECPCCGSIKAPGAVVTHGKPHWSMDFECMVVHRSIYCDGCAHVMHWIENSIFEQPGGQILKGPGFSSGNDYIRRYLTAHPQAQEVEQV